MPRPPLSQANRIGVLTTPLHADFNKLSENQKAQSDEPIVLVRFDASEGLSELFNYNIEALSADANIDFNKVLGKDCTVTIKTLPNPPGAGGSPNQDAINPELKDRRVFNGILTAAASLGEVQGEFFGYRLTLRPWPWLLTRTTNCRIFQDKDVVEIIKKIFEANKIPDNFFRFDIDGDFPKYEYCVQYRETDYNFISRLMEREGIFYYFKHTGNDSSNFRHVMVLTNAVSKLEPIRDHDRTVFLPVDKSSAGEHEIITDWSQTRQMRSGVVDLNDYNYEKPNAGMRAIDIGEKLYERGDMELYDYPGNYKDQDAGLRYAGIMLEAEQALDQRRFANGHAISLFPGGVTTLAMPTRDDERQGVSRGQLAELAKRFPPASEFKKYFIVRALHSYGSQEYRSSEGGSLDARGSYELQDNSIPFRAPTITPKPRIYGIQTAVVVDKQARGFTDKSQEEIEVEKLTEIYVHFYWDRNQSDEQKEHRSMKVRCAQLWAGKTWGAQFIPRIGMEVVVQFLEGDPDRPIVTGCVYNENNQPPWKLPSQKTISGIKSESTLGDHGCNYWNFEDKKGGEQINVHAQKDLNIIVNNNETRSVGNSMTTTIANKQTTTIGKKFKPPSGAPSRETTLENGDDKLTISQGSQTVTAKKNIELTAEEKIVLTVGASTITLEPAQITIQSPLVKIN